MDHLEARELLEIAAVEPGGYERLAAGDTPEAAALAGHLAGCTACADEWANLAEASASLRAAVRSMPPPDLRDRTLAFVAAAGRPRGSASVGGGPAELTDALPAEGTGGARGRRLAQPARWLPLALAAAIVIALVGVGGWLLTSRSLDESQQTVAALQQVTTEAIQLASASDARTVSLAPTPDAAAQTASGRLVYSVARGDLVVMAEGLPPPTGGAIYRCWVEDGTGRRILGDMEVSGDLAYWAGWSDALADVASDATFGVSLVPAGDASGSPVLAGS